MTSTLQSMSRSSVLAAGAGLAGAMFVGYCVYFDHKRRSAPDFKQKLREKRAASRQKQRDTRSTTLPDLRNAQEMQNYFLQECQIGEEMLGEGNIEQGIDHLSNAVAMCGQPQQLLQIFQQTLPAEVFGLLAEAIPKKQAQFGRLLRARGSPAPGEREGPTVTMVEDSELE